MKLYHWDTINKLADYSSGEVIVLAHSKHEAIEAACTDYADHACFPEDTEELRQELSSKTPRAYKDTTSILVWGGG